MLKGSSLVEIVTLVTPKDDKIQENMRQNVHNANDWCHSKMTASTEHSTDILWLLISYVNILKKENMRSGEFNRWKGF